jgi:hypothetical protein
VAVAVAVAEMEILQLQQLILVAMVVPAQL